MQPACSSVPALTAPLRRHHLLFEVEQGPSVGLRGPIRSAPFSGATSQSAPEIFASPVGAAGRVYIPSRDGTTVVLKHGPAMEMLAENKLSDGFDASPALVDSEIYLRGHRYLYCISER